MQSFYPYDMTLILGDIQSALHKNKSMPPGYFNIGIRFRAYREYKRLTYYNHEIFKHLTAIDFSVSLFIILLIFGIIIFLYLYKI